MEFQGEQRIAAPRETVYKALSDPETLKQAIPGCRSLDKTSDTEMEAVVALKVGPVQATFKGEVTLSDLDPPNGYTISGKGTGGPAGLARGSARVRLFDDGAGTRLTYEAKIDLSGKIAQLGGRLIQSTADRLSVQFFESFKTAVEAAYGPAPAAEEAVEAPAPLGRRRMWWAILAATVILLLLLLAVIL